jgi:urea carboxylase
MSSTQSESRYSWGADEHLVVMLSEAMSLQANFLAMAMASDLEAQNIEGFVDICPSNASLLVRFNPDIIAPPKVESIVREAEGRLRGSKQHRLETRIFELPVWFDDPYTNETQLKFRDRHQTPDGTDLDFAASENNLADRQAFIDAYQGSPWITSMVGFVAGLPFLFQMVPQERQLQVPKYVRPRTDTPKQTIGHGGCFAAIYSVRGAGGYQMFGITPVPIFDPEQKLPDFKDFMIFFRPGDIVKFRAVDEAEYREIEKQVEAGTYVYRQTPVTFDLEAFEADPDAYNAQLLEALYGN